MSISRLIESLESRRLLASVAGTVYLDADRDGVRDAGENGVAQRTVYVDLNNNSKLDSNEPRNVTNSSGSYKITNLAAGSYRIRQVLAGGYIQTIPTKNLSRNTTVSSSQNRTGINFGTVAAVVPPPPPPPAGGVIGGYLFNDGNDNGVQDGSEGRAPSRIIFIDTNGNNKLDSGEKQTTSNADGVYNFAGLPAGTYHITRVFPSGFRLSNSQTGFINVTLTENQANSSVNIGSTSLPLVPPPPTGGVIGGYLFNDGNDNGVQDGSEGRAPSRIVFIDTNGNNKLDSGEKQTTSNADGVYSFTGLPAGTYHITRVFPAGFRLSNSLTGFISITISDGQVVNTVHIGSTSRPIPTPPTPTPSLVVKISNALDYAETAYAQTLNDIGNNASVFVERTRSDGTWLHTSASRWTAGFLAGGMWQLFDHTDNTLWRDNAAKWTTSLEGRTGETGDLAFKFMTTYLPLYELTGNAAHRDVLLAAAASKNLQWNETVGAFRTTWFETRSGNPQANFPVLMDMTTDMELLIWAGRQTGNQTYIDRAIAHTEKVIANQIRPDGSISQFAMYDTATGQFIMEETSQGYSNSGVWSRGQAWAMLSLTMMARETGRADFAEAAKKVSDYYLANLPSDSVPYWDFVHPDIPNTYRDSSAAAVAASALLDLSNVLTDPADKARYKTAADKTLTSLLSTEYFNQGTSQRGLLKHGAGNVPNDQYARDTSLIYGDYYLLQAMNQWNVMYEASK